MQRDLLRDYSTALETSIKPSKLIWGFDFEALYPQGALISENMILKACSFKVIQQFIIENPDQIKSTNQNEFLFAKSSPEKLNFHDKISDCFVLIDKPSQKIIGINLNNVLDWSTYYIRYFGVVKDYRNQNVYSSWDRFFFSLLAQYGIERAECDVSPCNQVQNYSLIKHGFIQTGTRLSDRWGAQIIYTRFLDKENLRVFETQFCPLDTSKLQHNT